MADRRLWPVFQPLRAAVIHLRPGPGARSERLLPIACPLVVPDPGREDGLLYRTKGDANTAVDARLVGPEQIRAEPVVVVPEAGRVVLFLQPPTGIFLLVGLPLALFLVLTIHSSLRTWRQGKEPAEATVEPVAARQTLESATSDGGEDAEP